MLIDPRDYFGPEYDLWNAGDPFIRRLVEFDDAIADHDLLEEDHVTAGFIEQARLEFELETLARWWTR